MCCRLECLADNLPNQIDSQECLWLARELYPSIKKAHEFEENVVFPILLKNTRTCNLGDSIERLRFEHWEDEAFAEDISELLRRLGRGENSVDTEQLSWMLRGFFEGARRHIAFEKEYLEPLLSSIVFTQIDV